MTLKLPAIARSPAVIVVVQSFAVSHKVARALPPIKIIEPGPGVAAAKLAPCTSRINPPAAPAVALVGAKREMTGPLLIVTAAPSLLLMSCKLVATTLNESGDGAADGAWYRPVPSMVPHGAPEPLHPLPAMLQVTC